MALAPKITQAKAQNLLTQLETDLNAGTAAVIRGLDGSAPTNADDAETGTLGFTLTCSASIFATKTDGAPGAVGTLDTITQDSSADNTITLSYFRILTQTGGTICFQGSAGTATTDMIINTTAITAGSVVAATGTSTITVPEY
jgi:hypothetical protein